MRIGDDYHAGGPIGRTRVAAKMGRCACSSRRPSWPRWRPSGGLAHAAAGLTAELRRQGVDVDVVLPDYTGIDLAGERTRPIPVPDWAGPATVRVGEHAVAGELHLVRTKGIDRSHPYLRPDGTGWPDNAGRFLAFSQAIAALVSEDPPDVLHLNDWHTGAVLAALDDPATERALAAQPRLPGGDRGVVAPPPRAAGRALRVVGRDEPAVGGDRPRRQGRRRLAQLRPRRSSLRRAGSASTARCATAGPT